MVWYSEEKCGCSAFCKKIFNSKKTKEENNVYEDSDFNWEQLAECKDVTFTQPLQQPLTIGSLIICTGTPSDDLAWFAINLGTGNSESSRPDIALHFNVRQPQCYVVRNTRRHGRWGTEETTSFGPYPFKYDRPFSIEILVDENETLWAIDGHHFCSYAHRVPTPFAANWIQITGIRDAGIKLQTTYVYPSLAPPIEEIPSKSKYGGDSSGEPAWQANMVAALSNGIPHGYQLVITGRLRPLLHSFSIDLTDSVPEWPRANVHLHVNLRAYDNSHMSRQLVVLNGWFGAWGPERRQRTAKLIPNTKTSIRITQGPGEWQIYFDDLMIGELDYRAAAEGVKGLKIRGDIYPERIYLCPFQSTVRTPQGDNLTCKVICN